MSILIALLIGIGMGTATGAIFRRNGDYMVMDVVLGIVGALLGMILNFFTHLSANAGLFSMSGIVASIVGAAIFLVMYQAILKIPKTKHKHTDHT